MSEVCSRSHPSRASFLPAKWASSRTVSGETGAFESETAAGSKSSFRTTGPAAEPEPFFAVLIPAYRPSCVLIDVVRDLGAAKWDFIIVVDDGSGPGCLSIFKEISRLPKTQVVFHAINLGKGAALKTGINLILCKYPGVVGIVTVDADGQHHPADAWSVCERLRESPEALVLGVRSFKGCIPFRSRLGNAITRRAMRALVGHNLSDTQTGLRAIPRALLPTLLKVSGSGYDFELEMLIAAKHLGVRLIEQPIRTIYEPGNPSSHFRPLRDSMRIYFVLMRFSLISLFTAALDNLVFYLLFLGTGSIVASQAGARTASVLFQYPLVRRAVFLSDDQHRIVLPRFLLLVAANAAMAYLGIKFLTSVMPIAVFPAKVLAEAALFILSFLIQRNWIFSRRAR
jgi:putative flippase GtrA